LENRVNEKLVVMTLLEGLMTSHFPRLLAQ